jgi:hypothetical protein
MLGCWKIAARAVAIAALTFGFSTISHAVAPVGPVKRVDVDPGSPLHRFGIFYVTRTAPGGFAVAWEEDALAQTSGTVYERIRYRVYNGVFNPVIAPQLANLAGNRRIPTLSRIVPLGTNSVYLVYALTRDNASIDHPEVREGFGQRIVLATGKAFGPRQLINSAGIWDTLVPIASGLNDGRAVFGWRETDGTETPGRFIGGTSVLQPINLDFACCGANAAQRVGLQPLGASFVATYVRSSIFAPATSGIYARVFGPNGQPLAAGKQLLGDTIHPVPKVLSNGRIVVFRYVQIGTNPTRYILEARLYNQNLVPFGPTKILIPDVTSTKYVDFAPTRDGGLFMIRTLQSGSTFIRSVRRLGAALTPVGADYNFASPTSDFFRIAALSATRSVVLYRNIVAGRHRLFAQIVSTEGLNLSLRQPSWRGAGLRGDLGI